MIDPIFYLTGANGTKFSGKITTFYDQGHNIFSFRFDFSGDRFNIKRNDNTWTYNGGMENILDSWVGELGAQIDATQNNTKND